MADDDDDRDVILGVSPVPQENKTAIAVLQAQVRMISYIIRHDLVNKWEFTPIKLVVYGIVALLVSSVIAGLLTFVVKGH